MLLAGFAPLDNGVALSETVIVSGHRKSVQAPAAGVIKTLNVQEGSNVKAGDLLVQLNQVQALAQLMSLEEKRTALLVTQAHLLAEEQNRNEINFSSLPLNS